MDSRKSYTLKPYSPSLQLMEKLSTASNDMRRARAILKRLLVLLRKEMDNILGNFSFKLFGTDQRFEMRYAVLLITLVTFNLLIDRFNNVAIFLCDLRWMTPT